MANWVYDILLIGSWGIVVIIGVVFSLKMLKGRRLRDNEVTLQPKQATDLSGNLPEAVSPRGVAKDVVASVILILGAWLEISLGSLFPNGLPVMIGLILYVSEMTLFVYFIGAMFRAMTWSFGQADVLLKRIQESETRKHSKTIIRRLFVFCMNKYLTFISKVKDDNLNLIALWGFVLCWSFILGVWSESMTLLKWVELSNILSILAVLITVFLLSATMLLRLAAQHIFRRTELT